LLGNPVPFRPVSDPEYFMRAEPFKGLIPRALFPGEIRNILHEMNDRMRSKDTLGFARKK
jgi:hypothetical protein